MEYQEFTSEYENRPVPLAARKSTLSISAIWIAFPLVITPGVVGSLLVLGMGFKRAVLAILIGNIIQLIYVGLLGVLGARKGLSFALQSSITYGNKGFKIVSLLLATTLLGWVSVQNGIIGQFMVDGFAFPYWIMAGFAGIFILIISFFGIYGLYWISIISTPLYLIAAIAIIFDLFTQVGFAHILNFPAPQGNQFITMGAGISMTIATFIDGGTVNADYCRWAKNSKAAWIASFCAFPCANSVAMLLGGIIVAAYAAPGSSAFTDVNMFTFFVQKHLWIVTLFAIVFLYCNMGSVCAHTLYNSAMSWSHISNRKYQLVVLFLGIISLLIAITGIWQYLSDWLTILGIAIPPIGAVIIADQLILRPQANSTVNYRLTAFASVLIGIVAGIIVNKIFKHEFTAISSMMVAFLFYLLVSWKTRTR